MLKKQKTRLFFAMAAGCLLGYRYLQKKVLYDHRFGSRFARRFYNFFHSLGKEADVCVSNYGYAPVEEEMKRYDIWHRHGLQLYKELVTGSAGTLVPTSSMIVEMGCGKGAGGLFLVNHCHPLHYTGVDYSRVAIDFCKNAYHEDTCMKFICADAIDTGLPDNTADVVVSVESSHVYTDFGRFLREVRRILRPGGLFLLTDYRWVKDVPLAEFEEQLEAAGFNTIQRRDISQQVRRACIETTGLRKKLIRENIPWYLRRYFRHYAMLQGSLKLEKLGNGEMIYFIFQLRSKKTPKILQARTYLTNKTCVGG